MRPLWEPDREFAHKYETWDAAYVLGSLSPADRREFESHLGECLLCRRAITELSGVPALLSHLDHDVLASFDEVAEIPGIPAAQAPPPQLLPTLLATVRRRRRRARLGWISSAAAAAVLAVGVFVGVADQPLPAGPRRRSAPRRCRWLR